MEHFTELVIRGFYISGEVSVGTGEWAESEKMEELILFNGK